MLVLAKHRTKTRNHGAVLASLLTLALASMVSSSNADALNRIQLENAHRGTDDWISTRIDAPHDLEGYASLSSVNVGQSVGFFVNSADPKYSITVYRLGYYQGHGGRLMAAPVTLDGIRQPIPKPDPVTGLIECQWTNPYILDVPPNWASGLYVAKLTAVPSGQQRLIPFVVRNDDHFSDLIFQSSFATAEAYNAWGGKSLYAFNSSDGIAATKVSFNRPFDDVDGAGQILIRELNMAAFLEKEGYDVVYSTDLDTHEHPAQLALHRGFLAVGHNECWSDQMRRNVAFARNRGVSLGFFSANDAYSSVRFEASALSGASDRTMASVNARGSQAIDEAIDADIVVTDASNWVFSDTGLAKGSILGGLLGYAAGETHGNASMPAGSIELAHTPYVQSDGVTRFSDMTVYSTSSGATVFTAGTVQWAFGLSEVSPRSPNPSRVNPAAQQITRNVLSRFIDGAPSSSVASITSSERTAWVASAISDALRGAAVSATCWIAMDAATSGAHAGLDNFTRIAGTNYLTDCVDQVQPTMPADSQLVMKVDTRGGTITGVNDLRKAKAASANAGPAAALNAFGAKCDSSSDDAKALQAAINGAANGLLQLPEGNVTCVSSQPLLISRPITIDLNGSSLRFSGADGGTCAQGAGGQIQIRQGGAGPVTIKNGSITTTNPGTRCLINVGRAGLFTHPVSLDNLVISGAPGNAGTVGVYLNFTGEFSLTRSLLYYNLQQDVVGRNVVNVATVAGNTFGPLLNPANYQVDLQNPQSVLLQNNTHESGPNGVNLSGGGHGNQIESIWAGDTTEAGAWIHVGPGVSATKISGFMGGARIAGSVGVQIDAGASAGEVSGLTLQGFDTGLSLSGQGWSVHGNSIQGKSYSIRAMATNLRIFSNQIINGTAGGIGLSLEQPFEDAINNNYQIGGGAISLGCAAPALVIQEQVDNIPPGCTAGGNIVTAVDGRWISMGGGTIGNLGAPTAASMALSEGHAIGAIAPASGAFTALKANTSMQVGYPLKAPGGGRAAKLGRIGGTGPARASQDSWLEIKDSAGQSFWVPTWR